MSPPPSPPCTTQLLGQGKDGITFRVVEAASGAVYACKSIAKAPLLRAGAGEAIRTELRIMYHLQGEASWRRRGAGRVPQVQGEGQLEGVGCLGVCVQVQGEAAPCEGVG